MKPKHSEFKIQFLWSVGSIPTSSTYWNLPFSGRFFLYKLRVASPEASIPPLKLESPVDDLIDRAFYLTLEMNENCWNNH